MQIRNRGLIAKAGDQASVWSPSPREQERRQKRIEQARNRRLVAIVSSLVVLGSIAILIITSPGWQLVQGTFFDRVYGQEVLPKVILGFVTNISLTLIAGFFIAVFSLTLALVRSSRSPALTPFRFLATAYVDIFRGVPLLLVILLIGFGIPALQIKGLTNSVVVLGGIAVIVTYSAYVAEVIRSGILSVHPSQRAAARSLGLNQFQTMRHVILPQALRRVTPPLLNDLVSLLKDTGLISILGVTDAVRAAQIEASRSFNYTPYVTATILFLLITIPLTRFTDRSLRISMEHQNAQGVA
jgi:polar amino acid transport system permease protein